MPGGKERPTPAGCPRPGRRGDEAGTCIPHWDPRETGRGCRQGWSGGSSQAANTTVLHHPRWASLPPRAAEPRLPPQDKHAPPRTSLSADMASRHKKKKKNNNPKRFTLQRRAGNSDCSYRQRWLGVPGRPTRGPHRKGVLVTAVRRCGCRYGAAAGPFLSRKHPGKRFPSRTWCSPGNARLRGGGGGEGFPRESCTSPAWELPP